MSPCGTLTSSAGKPHLLVSTTNNMGAVTPVQYNASTKFYVQDRETGRPWVTKLPFPVHVIGGKTARPVVCPAKAGMFSRRKACRGKSQKPRSLDSRVAGNQNSEAYRQRLPWGGDESPGRNDSERKSGLESE